MAEFEAIQARLGSVWNLPSESAVRAQVARLNSEIDDIESVRAFERFDADDVVTAWKHTQRQRKPTRS